MCTVVIHKKSLEFYQVLHMTNKLKLTGHQKSNLTQLKAVLITITVKHQRLEVKFTKNSLRFEKFSNELR